MDSTPTPEAPAPLAAAGGKKGAWSRNISWVALCGVLVIPVAAVGIAVLQMTAESFFPLGFLQEGPQASEFSFAVTVLLAVVAAWRGVKRGWNTSKALRRGWLFTLLLVPLVMIWVSSIFGGRMRPSSVDKAVLNNARYLAAAASQYFLENGVTTCTASDLVGLDKYVKVVNLVAGETYPVNYTQGVPIKVTGVAGARTLTYAP